MSGQMICLAVGFSSGGVGMGCQVVKFRGSIMRTLGHGVLLPCSMQINRPGSSERSFIAWIKPKGSILSAFPQREWSPHSQTRHKAR
jgi:hypothetical protein